MTDLNNSYYIKKIDKIIHKFPWYNNVILWWTQGYVSDKEIKDGLNYLMRLRK